VKNDDSEKRTVIKIGANKAEHTWKRFNMAELLSYIVFHRPATKRGGMNRVSKEPAHPKVPLPGPPFGIRLNVHKKAAKM